MCKRHHLVNSVNSTTIRLLPFRKSQIKSPTPSCVLSQQWGLCSSDRLSMASLVFTRCVMGAVCASALVYRDTAAEHIRPSLPFQTGVKSKCRLQSGTTISGQCNQLQLHQEGGRFAVPFSKLLIDTIRRHLQSTHIHQEC